MSQSLSIIIVEKSGELKALTVKDFKEDDLYKKCGFKKVDGFSKQTEWNGKYFCDGKKYTVSVFAKDTGRANSENKYDFPPPIDTSLFFGSCAIIATAKKEDGSNTYVDLSLSLWNKIYEKLFGGFEDLAATAAEDEEEEDELENIPKEKKTKHGYLKDGFVVDSSEDEEDESGSETEDEDEDSADSDTDETDEKDAELLIEDIGSELSEESYD